MLDRYSTTINANSLKLLYEVNKNEQNFIVPHIVEKEVLLVCYGTVTFSVVKFISIKKKLMYFLNDTCPELFTQNAKKYGKSIFDLIHVDSSYKTRMLMCTPDEYNSVICTGNVMKTSLKENSFLHELSSLPNHELKGVSVSMWLKHQFETKMSLLDVKNLNNSLGTGYGQREYTKHKGLQAYFGPKYCYRPLMNPNYG